MNTVSTIRGTRSGFTIVEIAVALAIIGILVTAGFIANTTVQQNARNGQRQTGVTAIADALERYFEKHGEYPGCDMISALSANPSASPEELKSIDKAALVAPKAGSDTQSSLECTELNGSNANDDIYAYEGDSGAACTSGNMCTKFTLRYREEGTGEVITITSKREAEDLAPTPPTSPLGTIAVEATLSGGDAIGTASGATCKGGAGLEYQIRQHPNENAWSGWTDGITRSVAATQGYEYTFQAQARCVNGTLASEWIPSSEASVTRPVSAPTGITMTAAMNGTDARGTVGGGSCAPGTTLRREIRSESTNTTTAGTWSSWQAIAGTTHDVAANQGYRYTFENRAQCEGLKVSSGWTSSPTASTVRSIGVPSTPGFVVSATPANATSYTASVSCPSGTSTMYNSRFYHDTWTGGWYETSASTVTWGGNVDQGYNYVSQIQARCYTPHTTSGWSGVATANWVRPIATPGAAWGWSFSIAGNRRTWSYAWSAPACGPGTRQEYRYNSYAGPPGQWNWAGGGNYLGWNTHQWWAANMTFTMQGSATVPHGRQAQNAVQYICVNTATGRKSAYGPEAWSPVYGT